ncbi:efflux RND transporter periplasmic adaptor subunit [bacterium SCSIO 12741]|nr:efflux RND transporter periplasmic adaptor subunit [bacterium SCSIO 12741]
MSKNTWLIIGAVVLILVLLIIGKKQFGGGSTEVYVEKIERMTIVETVTANGKIQPEKEVKISSEVSGEIVDLLVKEGAVVDSGQLLVRINPDILESSVERMEATLNSTKANLSNAKARQLQSEARLRQSQLDFDRNEKLWKQGAVSQAELDQVRSAFEVAQAEVDAAKESVKGAEYSVRSTEAELSQARENLLRTTLYAPISGTVTRLEVEAGERVVGTAQMTGTEMLRIANLDNMEVKVEVNESDIVRVGMGDSVEVEVDAYLERKFLGLVTEIANSANDKLASTEQVTTFDVRIRLVRESYQDLMEGKGEYFSPFRPGMSATVEIKTQKVENVVAVPIQSVTLRPDSLKPGELLSTVDRDEMNECIFVSRNGKVERIFVKTGVQDENYIQLLDADSLEGEVVKGPYSAVSRKLLNDKAVEVKPESHFSGEKQ